MFELEVAEQQKNAGEIARKLKKDFPKDIFVFEEVLKLIYQNLDRGYFLSGHAFAPQGIRPHLTLTFSLPECEAQTQTDGSAIKTITHCVLIG